MKGFYRYCCVLYDYIICIFWLLPNRFIYAMCILGQTQVMACFQMMNV